MTTINVGTATRLRHRFSATRTLRATNNGGTEFIRAPELARLNILPRHECVRRYFSISPPISTINCLVSPLILFVRSEIKGAVCKRVSCIGFSTIRENNLVRRTLATKKSKDFCTFRISLYYIRIFYTFMSFFLPRHFYLMRVDIGNIDFYIGIDF